MKKKPWFRWYRDTAMDAKLRFVRLRASDLAWPERADKSELVVSLTDVVAVWALLLESVTDDNGTVTVPLHLTLPEYVADAYDMDAIRAEAIIKAMQDYSLLTSSDSGLQVRNWQNRQYLDDTNAERQARHRARQKDNDSITDNNVRRNGLVTHRQSTETETETETEKIEEKPLSFIGKVIRLNETDHSLWKQSFKHIDVDGSLASRDAYLAGTEDLTARKNWFVSTAAWLRNKNEEAKKANGKGKSQGMSPPFKPFKPLSDPPKPSEEERAKQIEKFLKVRTLPKVHRSSA